VTIYDLVGQLGLTLLDRPTVDGKSMTIVVSKSASRVDALRRRTFNIPYPLTDKACEALKKALANW
jgi:hypothetical protein